MSSLEQLIEKFGQYRGDLVHPFTEGEYSQEFDRYKEIVTEFLHEEKKMRFNNEEWKRIAAKRWLKQGKSIDDLLEALLIIGWRDSIDSQNIDSTTAAISARLAEKAVKRFYSQLGYQVEDVSITQPQEQYNLPIGRNTSIPSQLWQTCDLRAGTYIVDVKNARCNQHGAYSRFFVKKFKKYKSKKDVIIFSVLSPIEPYSEKSKTSALSQTSKKYARALPEVLPPTCLGITDSSVMKSIVDYIKQKRIGFDFSRPGCSIGEYLPPWLFDYPDEFYQNQMEVCNELASRTDQELDRLAGDHVERLIPLLIAAKRRLPAHWYDHLSEWEREFIDGLVELPCGNRITLPWLFCYLLQFFIATHRGQHPDHSPAGWRRLLYSTQYPLGIYDPLGIISSWINALEILYKNLLKSCLNFDTFDFKGPRLLRARRGQEEWKTLLAYCGGCGLWPLIFGREETCQVCNYLACKNCYCCKKGYGFYSADCKSYFQIINQNIHTHSHKLSSVERIDYEWRESHLYMHTYFEWCVEELPWVDPIAWFELLFAYHPSTFSPSIERPAQKYENLLKTIFKIPIREHMHESDEEKFCYLQYWNSRNGTCTLQYQGKQANVKWDYTIQRDEEKPLVVKIIFHLEMDISDMVIMPAIQARLHCSINKEIFRSFICGVNHLHSHLALAKLHPDPAFSLEDAIDKVPPHGLVLIPPGEHVLERPLRIHKPVTLVGAGTERTIILSKSEECGIEIDYQPSSEAEKVILHGFALRCEDSKSSYGVLVKKGKVNILCSRFEGAAVSGVCATGNSQIIIENTECINNRQAGIALINAAQGKVQNSICCNNGRCGIVAQERSRLIATNNTCEGNQQAGIALLGEAQGEVQSNTCRNNGYQGIYAGGQSRLTATNNTCEGNQQAGIALLGETQGEVQGNTCRNNGYYGISAQEQSRLTATNNTCEGNQEAGIALFGEAQGVVQGNACCNNRHCGIIANDQSHLSAMSNTCESNLKVGIALLDAALGELQGNTCRNNNYHGIYAGKQSRLIAANNICEGNQRAGIFLSDESYGEVQGSTCQNNGRHGIYAGKQSRLIAANNICEGNQQAGIALFGEAQGEARANTCRNNGRYGISAHERSHLIAIDNICEGNQQAAVALFDDAQAEVRRDAYHA